MTDYRLVLLHEHPRLLNGSSQTSYATLAHKNGETGVTVRNISTALIDN